MRIPVRLVPDFARAVLWSLERGPLRLPASVTTACTGAAGWPIHRLNAAVHRLNPCRRRVPRSRRQDTMRRAARRLALLSVAGARSDRRARPDPRARQPGRGDLDLVGRRHHRAVQGPRAGLGRELPRLRDGRLLRPGPSSTAWSSGLRGPGRRLHRDDGEKPTPAADSERGDQRAAQRPRHGRDGAHGRPAQRHRRSSTSTSPTTPASITRASRRATSATPCSAACSPGWTSSTGSPPSRPTSTAGMDDVPVEPVMITGVKVVR